MPISKPLVLFFNPVRYATKCYEQLSVIARTEIVLSKSRQEFFEDITTKYKDAVAIYRTSATGGIVGKFDEEFVKNLPLSLKFICHNGAGYDQIDVESCKRRDITVTYAPDPVTGATADLTLFLLLGAIRQLSAGMKSLRQGNFKTGLRTGHDPKGKVLGILGMGRIGKAVAFRAAAFGLKVIYHNRKFLQENETEGAAHVTFEDLLSYSDIISIHVPFTASTHYLIGKKEMARMKKGVVILNTARGQIINEAELVTMLEVGHVAAVGLDVYENEPFVHPGLIDNDRALLVPHMGTWTEETMAEMEALAMENIRRGICGQELLTVVPEALPKPRREQLYVTGNS